MTEETISQVSEAKSVLVLTEDEWAHLASICEGWLQEPSEYEDTEADILCRRIIATCKEVRHEDWSTDDDEPLGDKT